MMLLWQIGILFLCPLATYQRSIPSSPSYIGAVVEYTPVTKIENGLNPADINADNYLKFVEKAKKHEVDILVFPESSLSISTPDNEAASYIPDPKDGVIPCNDQTGKYKSSLEKLSCAARVGQMYIVINHREKVDCTAKTADCPASGYLIYNSHVTFDRDGKVIARYRKYNLFGEPGVSRTETPELSTFATDFGVEFGQFICFDVLFEAPAVNLTRDLAVTDIVYSAHWFNELPYGFSNEVQAGWAYATDTNFLAAGHNNPSTGSGGSGIFIGRKGHAHVITEEVASNVLVVAEIPKKINGERQLNIDQEKLWTYRFDKTEISTSADPKNSTGKFNYRSTDLSDYQTELIDTESKTYNKTLCNRELCCEFELKVEFDESAVLPSTEYYRYRLAAFNNTMSFAGRGSGQAKICGLLACLDDKLDSCGKLMEPKVNVVYPTKLAVKIRIPKLKDERAIFLPVSLARGTHSGSPLPLNATDFTFARDDKDEGYALGLTEPRKDLMTFVVVGRIFGRNNVGSVGGPILSLLSLLLAFSLLARVF